MKGSIKFSSEILNNMIEGSRQHSDQVNRIESMKRREEQYKKLIEMRREAGKVDIRTLIEEKRES